MLRDSLSRVVNFAHSLLRIVSLSWKACPNETVLMVGLNVLRQSNPFLALWVMKGIVDTVTVSTQSGFSTELGYRLACLTVLLFMPFLANRLWWPAKNAVQTVARAKLNSYINVQICKKVARVRLAFFDSAESYNKLENARKEATDHRALSIVEQAMQVLGTGASILILTAVMTSFNPILMLLLFLGAVPDLAVNSYLGARFRDLLRSKAPETRKMDYVFEILRSNRFAKEVRLFGYANYLQRRYDEVFDAYSDELMRFTGVRTLIGLIPSVLTGLVEVMIYCIVIWFAIIGRITVGKMTLFLGVSANLSGSVQRLFRDVNQTIENGLFVTNLFELLNSKVHDEPSRIFLEYPAGVLRNPSIELRNVTFHYPGTQVPALADINVRIEYGQRVAIVGLNGAGKTTLVKLLLGLYSPDEGEVLINGIDIRNLPPAIYRRLFSVCFQDYFQYAFSFRENVGLGDIALMQDENRVIEAARRAGAMDVVASLPFGLDTYLSREFDENGVPLSGGQWQKVALARMFMREAPIYIMDEPTAALDAEAEHRIYEEFADKTSGKTSIVITHRLSSVIMADRILVLDAGRLVEYGTHAELMAENGLYSRLFNMQAERYRERTGRGGSPNGI